MVISKLIGLSPIFLSIIVASRNEPNRKNSSIFPVALLWEKKWQKVFFGEKTTTKQKTINYFIDSKRWPLLLYCQRSLFTSEMLEIGSTWTSVELMISGDVVSRISTATEIRRRALKDTPSPSPSFRSWCSSISVYWRVEPYMLTQAGPRVGKKPEGFYIQKIHLS